MLEMFERLLAALIILALLVLVMFIALPYPSGSDRASAPVADLPPVVTPTATPPEAARAKPPASAPTGVAQNDTPPQAIEPPGAPTQEAPVPNPPGKIGSENPNNKAPAASDKGEREIGAGETRPKLKFVKTFTDRLTADAEQPSKPVIALKGDKPTIEKPKTVKPKADKLRIERPKTETVTRVPVQPAPRVTLKDEPPPRVYLKSERIRDDGIGEYIRRADYGTDWNRTHYYECSNGRCDCSCDRPYWARRGPPCD